MENPRNRPACAAALLIGCLFLGGCSHSDALTSASTSSIPHRENEQIPPAAVQPSTEPSDALVLRASQQLERISNVRGDGSFSWFRYPGPRHLVAAKVTKIVPGALKAGASDEYQDDQAYFRVSPFGAQVLTGRTMIELLYDPNLNIWRFQEGQTWVLALTDRLELINLWPANSPIVYEQP